MQVVPRNADKGKQARQAQAAWTSWDWLLPSKGRKVAFPRRDGNERAGLDRLIKPAERDTLMFLKPQAVMTETWRSPSLLQPASSKRNPAKR